MVSQMALVELKQKLHPFELIMGLHGLLRWPAMTRKEMRILKRVFLSFPKNQTINIFEYGMGFSTLYFAKFLQNMGRSFHIDSLDNNRFWYEKVTAMIRNEKLSDSVTLHLREFAPFWEKSGWNWQAPQMHGTFAPSMPEENEYIVLPQTLHKHYNVIFVDARFRRRCLETALQAVDHRGIVILHDAQKKQYQSSTELYRHSRFIDSGKYFPFARKQYQIWLGSPTNTLVEEIAREFA